MKPLENGGLTHAPGAAFCGARTGANIGRVDVSEPASISAGIAQRYATAIFEIAEESKALDSLETSLNDLAAALDGSEDLQTLISSPLLSRGEQERALIAALRARLADARGEVTAEVTSAKALTKTQSEKLAKTLAGRVGKKVTVNATVDADIIGGLVVKVGSKMIDTSIRSKLNSLQNAMKEVG